MKSGIYAQTSGCFRLKQFSAPKSWIGPLREILERCNDCALPVGFVRGQFVTPSGPLVAETK